MKKQNCLCHDITNEASKNNLRTKSCSILNCFVFRAALLVVLSMVVFFWDCNTEEDDGGDLKLPVPVVGSLLVDMDDDASSPPLAGNGGMGGSSSTFLATVVGSPLCFRADVLLILLEVPCLVCLFGIFHNV